MRAKTVKEKGDTGKESNEAHRIYNAIPEGIFHVFSDFSCWNTIVWLPNYKACSLSFRISGPG